MNVQALLAFLIQKGEGWVRAQRNHHRPAARPLSDVEKAHFAPFFDPPTLEAARIKRVPAVENPDFYVELQAQGVLIPLDFTVMAGITFNDTILLADQRKPPGSPLAPLLFHELVHVVQYEILGVPVFVERYVQSWVQNGFQYAAIPLERDAYDLQARYEAQPHRAFSVRAEVRHRLGLS